MSGNSRLRTCHFLCLHSERLDPRWVAWLWGISMLVVVVEAARPDTAEGWANLPVRWRTGKNNNYQSENKYPAIN